MSYPATKSYERPTVSSTNHHHTQECLQEIHHASVMASDYPHEDDLLYHVKLEVTDYHEDKSGATRTTNILGTFTRLDAAKIAALGGLEASGYIESDFEEYAQKLDPEDWTHGDGVLVYAKAPAGQEFEVKIDTKPNTGFKGNEQGEAVDKNLHYVLQTKIDYNTDRVGGKQATEIEGVYLHRKDAIDAAKKVLINNEDSNTRESFAEYDEKENVEMSNEWPFGDDCLIHAVGMNGENFLISVKVQPHKGQKHVAKTAQKAKKHVTHHHGPGCNHEQQPKQQQETHNETHAHAHTHEFGCNH